MGNFLYNIGLSLMDIGIKRLLAGAGLGLVVYTTLKTMFNSMIDKAIEQMQGGSDIALAFLGLAGVDEALSVIISAMLVRVTILSSQVNIVKS